MCHGQVVSQRILRARRDHECGACGRTVRRGRRFFFGTVLGTEDGYLSNYKLCTRCVAVQEREWESGGCSLDTDDDEARRLVRERGWRWLRGLLKRTR